MKAVRLPLIVALAVIIALASKPRSALTKTEMRAVRQAYIYLINDLAEARLASRSRIANFIYDRAIYRLDREVDAIDELVDAGVEIVGAMML